MIGSILPNDDLKPFQSSQQGNILLKSTCLYSLATTT